MCGGMYVLSCVAHLLYKLSNLQLDQCSNRLYTGQPAMSIFPKTRPVPYDPSLHPACVGRLMSICNGLGLKLKTLSFTQTALRPHNPLCCQQSQQCCQLPSSTLSHILCSCNGLSPYLLSFLSLCMITCVLFYCYHCEQEQISRHFKLSLHN